MLNLRQRPEKQEFFCMKIHIEDLTTYETVSFSLLLLQKEQDALKEKTDKIVEENNRFVRICFYSDLF